MKIDGGLRSTFREHLPLVHWVPVETGLTMSGVPDHNGCYASSEFWVEYKNAPTGRIKKNKTTPFQISWHERRARSGGRTFLAARWGEAIHLYRGEDIRVIYTEGLGRTDLALLIGHGGPSKWNWEAILSILVGRYKT